MNNMSLGNNIKKFRKEQGLTQEELAGILCVTSQAVSKWESENGLPDTAQIVPLAKALNVSTDALFGFASSSYDKQLAEKIIWEADGIRDSGEPAEGALKAADFLDAKCEEDIFNYSILMRYVQAVAHMSRFVNYKELFADDKVLWQKYVRNAENRGAQVIRYSDEKELVEKCHYALAWIYWHEKDFAKGREHISALPSVQNNMLQETINSYYDSMENSEDGNPDYEAWRISVRDNFQNFVRAINKQFVYSAESTMWTFPIEVSEPNDLWAISVMEKIMENDVMKAHCQGFYRDTVKYLIGVYLRNGMADKAAELWKSLVKKMDEHVLFCEKQNAMDKAEALKMYGEKSIKNMSHYTKEYAESKKQFMLNQLKSWFNGEVWQSFEKMI